MSKKTHTIIVVAYPDRGAANDPKLYFFYIYIYIYMYIYIYIYIYKLSYLGIIETHLNENPTVCPVSPGFELMTSCI